MVMAGRFANKVALITAAASGIGAATAEAFAREGARLMLTDINETGVHATAERLCKAGADARAMRADATAEEEVERLVRATVETFGALHVAGNVVGDVLGDAAGPEFHKQSVQGWDATLAVSLRSTFLSMKHEITYMIDHGGGVICNVTSLAGLLHVPESGAAYAAAKAGVVRLTKFAAINYADRGVRVNCIAPGVTPTPAYYKAGPEAAKMLIDGMLERQPIKRTIEPSEQAAGIVWLCSDEASMVTGQVLAIDGGWTAR
jgi:NAD(P)-dependent dehydrogenase (short-subunit alcohol dehydrogenase family)